MKIMLLNPPNKVKISRDSRWPELTKSGTLYYPFWLGYATAVLMESKHKPLLLDAIAKDLGFDETLDRVTRFDPELLVIETSTPTIKKDAEFAEEVKKVSNVKIVFGGTHVTALPHETLKMFKATDFVAKQELDYTILDLATTLENRGNIGKVKGISYRNNKKIIDTPPRPLPQDLDAIPFVSKAYKKFLDVRDYCYALARHPMIQIWTSRGCPARCTFCVYPQIFTMHSFRVRSPKNVVDEISWIKKNLPEIKEIFFEDDTFSIDQKRVAEICDEIQRRNLKVTWSCNTRAQLKYPILKKMKDAGCRILIAGYESGNQKILNNIKKGTTLEQAREFTRDAKKVGLRIFGCFMIGLPGDTKETIQETYEFAKELNPDMVFFQQAVPFPGTEFYDWAKKNGFLLIKDWDDWLDENGRLRCLVNYPEISAEEIDALRDKLMVDFYTDPKHIIQTIMKNLHPVEGIRVARYALAYASYLLKRKLSKTVTRGEN